MSVTDREMLRRAAQKLRHVNQSDECRSRLTPEEADWCALLEERFWAIVNRGKPHA